MLGANYFGHQGIFNGYPRGLSLGVSSVFSFDSPAFLGCFGFVLFDLVESLPEETVLPFLLVLGLSPSSSLAIVVAAETVSPLLLNLIKVTPCVSRPSFGMFLRGSLII